jgi:hypothetical protein
MIYKTGKIFAGLLVVILLFSFESCSRKHMNAAEQGILSSSKTDSVKIPDNNISESNADLFTVNYREFYDKLSRHGKWIEVNAKELGIDKMLNKSTASGEIEDRDEFLSHVFGVKDASVETVADVDWGVFFVWSPDPGLAVTVSAGEPAYYVPYEDGEWYYTDDGWYFGGATDYEDITFHYGRWVLVPDYGWIWVPGRVWAPAWVEWYEDDDYIAWAPIPPECYFANDVIVYPWFNDDDRFICVEKSHFLDPEVYRYRYFYDGPNPVHISGMRRVDGLYARNNMIYDRGPQVGDIQKHRGSNIDKINIQRVHDPGSASFSGNRMKVYTPQFSRYKGGAHNMNKPVSRPKTYVSMNSIMHNMRSKNHVNLSGRNGNQNSITGNRRSRNNGIRSLNNSGKTNGANNHIRSYSHNKKSMNSGYSRNYGRSHNNSYNGNHSRSHSSSYGKNYNGSRTWNNGNKNRSYSPNGRSNNSNENRGSYRQSSGSRNQGSYRQSSGQHNNGSRNDRSNHGNQRNGRR